MRKIPVAELKPGMTLAKDVYNHEDGRLLLLKGFSMQQRYIEKLNSLGILYVYIDEEAPLIILEDRGEQEVYNEAFSTMKDVLTTVTEGGALEVAPVKDTVDDIVGRVINNESVFTQLTGMKDIDNYTFHHCVDVCVFSVITGKHLGLSDEELTELGMGSILHDIGKCRVPLSILNKPGKLTDDEFMTMKLHSIYGFEIIQNTQGLSKRIANIACQHHEKWNGTGYPSGLRDNQIDLLSRIVTIADVYDAITANRCYKKKSLPHEAAEFVISNAGIMFDPTLAKTFINNITIYPEGTMVILNTGEIGSVTESDHVGAMGLRPKLRIISRKDGPPVFAPYVIDLSANQDLFIVDIINNI
ncbi:MAG: HD-GYP domain-containing protein [Deltaproteobacteria bacterium]